MTIRHVLTRTEAQELTNELIGLSRLVNRGFFNGVPSESQVREKLSELTNLLTKSFHAETDERGKGWLLFINNAA